MDGKMLWFNEEKDFGYIGTEDGERIYVHRSGFLPGHVPVGRCAGLPVHLTAAEGEDGLVAIDVSVAVEAQHGRARRRRASGRAL